MRIWQSCSWCDELVQIDAALCPTCGHEAHVPRAQCACSRCVAWRIAPGMMQAAELQEGLPELLDWLKGKGHADLAEKLAAIKEEEQS